MESSSDYCLIPNETVQNVTSCPNNDIEWRERIVRKNCSAYANMCNGTYEYHCLIEAHINKLFEVCVERKLIHLGKYYALKIYFLLILIV